MPYEALEAPPDGDWEGVRRNFRNLRKDMNPPVPQARVFNSANISINNATLTSLTFDSERWDESGLHSTSANTSRLTAPITGLYHIGGNIRWDGNTTGNRQLGILVNGATLIALDFVTASGGDVAQNISADYRLAAGDYAELNVFQSSGAARNVVAAAAYTPEFWMYRVGGYVNQGV